MPRHTLERVEYARYIVCALPAAYKSDVACRSVRGKREADVRGRRAPRKADGRLLLKVVRRQKVIIGGMKGFKIRIAALCGLKKIAALIVRKLGAAPRRKSKREGCGRR